MPFFRTTKDIFYTPWQDELHNDNFFDTPFLQLPPSMPWKYDRELKIEDVDIWEQIYAQGGGLALYAAWNPYAELYMITHHNFRYKENAIETFYGKKSGKAAYERAIELGMPISTNSIWVSDEDMWLYI